MTDLEQKPRLRFKGFTEAWEQRKLDQVASYRNGKAHENSIDSEGVYIVVNSKFVSTDGEVIKKSNEQIEPLFKNELAFVLSDVPNGRAIARTFLVQKDGLYTLNQRIAGITPSSDTCPYFLHILMNRNKYFLAFDDGAKQTNLSVKDVLEFEANYPNFKEQERIGALFDSLDVLITLHQRKYEKLKSMKAALLEKMFSSENETTPKIRFKGFTEAWEQRKLGDIFEFERPDKYMIKDDHYEETGIPVLTANKAFILGYKNETGAYSKGDCIIFDDFTLDSKYVDFPYKINSSVIKILTLKDNSNLKFDYYLLNQAKILQQGHARHYISVVQPTIVNVPKKCESNKIEKLFTNLDSLITLHQRKCEKLKNLKKSLLERMFI